ncbi:hypothetical protein KCP74_07565 [Salmonella enterica subsp. enterica]|nr:hypothetical protein KCP74_07565 [Salmonella enterica subsp. enterica]
MSDADSKTETLLPLTRQGGWVIFIEGWLATRKSVSGNKTTLSLVAGSMLTFLTPAMIREGGRAGMSIKCDRRHLPCINAPIPVNDAPSVTA